VTRGLSLCVHLHCRLRARGLCRVVLGGFLFRFSVIYVGAASDVAGVLTRFGYDGVRAVDVVTVLAEHLAALQDPTVSYFGAFPEAVWADADVYFAESYMNRLDDPITHHFFAVRFEGMLEIPRAWNTALPPLATQPLPTGTAHPLIPHVPSPRAPVRPGAPGRREAVPRLGSDDAGMRSCRCTGGLGPAGRRRRAKLGCVQRSKPVPPSRKPHLCVPGVSNPRPGLLCASVRSSLAFACHGWPRPCHTGVLRVPRTRTRTPQCSISRRGRHLPRAADRGVSDVSRVAAGRCATGSASLRKPTVLAGRAQLCGRKALSKVCDDAPSTATA